VYLQIGESGRQQVKYGFACFLLKAYTPFLVLQYTFVSRSTDFTCHRGSSSLYNQCFENKVDQCDNITYAENTIVSEWDLVCERNWLGKATMSALMFGFLVGALMLGNLADRIGRKSNLILTLIGMLIFNLISSMTSLFSVYIVSRFLVGFFIAGKILSIVVLISELVGSSYRGMYGLTVMGAFPVGIVFLSGLAYNIQDWRPFSASVSVLGLPFLAYHWYLVESPRWLFNNNREREAKAVLNIIAKGNGASVSSINNLKPHIQVAGEAKESFLHLLPRKRLLLIVYVLAFSWFVNGASYYGLTLAAGTIGTDLYTGFALSGLVELPAVGITYIAIERIGRRLGLSYLMIASGVSCLLIQTVTGGQFEYLAISLALLGKMCIAGSFKVAYILSGEIFATSIRNSGLGIMSSTARVGSILSPFIVMAGEQFPGVQFLLFGVLGVSGGILALWLPETKGRPLPETISDMLFDKTKKISINDL